MEKLITTSIRTWDRSFFEAFVALRNEIHREDPSFSPETVEHYERHFGSTSAFARNNHWLACLVSSPGGEPVFRLLASCPKKTPGKRFAGVGALEGKALAPGPRAGLVRALRAWANDCAIGELRGPMFGGFFGTQRALIQRKKPLFFGEPDNPPRYLKFWEDLGFARQNDLCVSYDCDASALLEHNRNILSSLYRSTSIPDVTARPMDPDHWDREMKILFDIFSRSFAHYDDFTPAAEEEFLMMQRPLQALAGPGFGWFAEHRGRPIAFLIGYLDPFSSGAPDLIIPYGGKLPDAKGVKAVTSLLMFELVSHAPKDARNAVCAYLLDGSPMYMFLPRPSLRERSTYDMFRQYL